MDHPILTTFPTPGSPPARVSSNLRSFPVRFPSPSSSPSPTTTTTTTNPGKIPGTSTKQARAPAVNLNRWFCCQCALRGYRDPVGMVNRSDTASSVSRQFYNYSLSPEKVEEEGCWLNREVYYNNTYSSSSSPSPPLPYDRAAVASGVGAEPWGECTHKKCHNCLASPTHSVRDAVRTFGGLHYSPRFIDPVYWECGSCGEWVSNVFSREKAEMGRSVCQGKGCVDWRYSSAGGWYNISTSDPLSMQMGFGTSSGNTGGGLPGMGMETGTGTARKGGVLMPDSIVMNVYGQRLGTADQSVMVLGGPWHLQRLGLGDGRNALVDAFREEDHGQQQHHYQHPQHQQRGSSSSSQQHQHPYQRRGPLLGASSHPLSKTFVYSSSASGGGGGSDVIDGTKAMLPPRPPIASPPPLTSGTTRTTPSQIPIWNDGEPVPRYPYRPGPPPTVITPWKSVITRNLGGEDESQELAYRAAYLATIPSEPRIQYPESSFGSFDSGGGAAAGFGGVMGGEKEREYSSTTLSSIAGRIPPPPPQVSLSMPTRSSHLAGFATADSHSQAQRQNQSQSNITGIEATENMGIGGMGYLSGSSSSGGGGGGGIGRWT